MKYCSNCIDPDTRPNSTFDKNGLCNACNHFNKTKEIKDIYEKFNTLKDIIKKYPKKKSSFFDCIIGVSGGKDSTRQAVWLRDKLGLNPLLVCCAYPPEQVTEIGVKNLSNLINLGFDVLISAPSPQTWKKILKKGFYKGNYLHGPEIALYSSLPQIAIKYDINLIFWGENPATIWNDKRVSLKNEYDGNYLRYTNTLKDCKIDWMKDCVSDSSKLIPYKYPTSLEFKKNNIQIIFLSAFWNNWSFSNNAKISILHGLKIKEDSVEKTGDLFGVTALDDNWLSINQMIKYYKFGFGRVTDYLNFEIRSGKIKRKEAIVIAQKYDGKCSIEYIKDFCRYIDITLEEFYKNISKFVNKKLFTIDLNKSENKFLPKFKVGTDL